MANILSRHPYDNSYHSPSNFRMRFDSPEQKGQFTTAKASASFAYRPKLPTYNLAEDNFQHMILHLSTHSHNRHSTGFDCKQIIHQFNEHPWKLDFNIMAQTFQPFINLPSELKDKIWNHALLCPRMITLSTTIADTPESFERGRGSIRDYATKTNINPIPTWLLHAC